MQGDDAQRDYDRELIELLNELRVALPGVQVLFAFLLIVPFSQGFPQVTDVQKAAYFAAFVFASAASAFLIAPSAYHRIQFRNRDKKNMIETANREAICGLASLCIAMVAVIFLIGDVLFASAWATVVTVPLGGLLVWLWFGLPLVRRMRRRRPEPSLRPRGSE